MAKGDSNVKLPFTNPDLAAMPVVRHRFSPMRRVVLDCTGDIGADQSFAAECDINNIMKRFGVTGQMIDPTVMATRMPRYEDLSTMPEDLLDAQLRVKAAEAAFADLPAAVRDRFANNVLSLVEFLSDPQNAAEAAKLGLMNPDFKVPASKTEPPPPAA